MMDYTELLIEADSNFLITKEKNLYAYDGRIKGNRIALRRDMPIIKKKCVLAEELGHYFTTIGSILDQSNLPNRKQELHAREWAYNKLVGLGGIIEIYQHGCATLHDAAEYLDVTEDFLKEALQYYKSKYGICATLDRYIIYFDPTIGVFELRK